MSFSASRDGLQFAPDNGAQTRQIAFHDDIARASLHEADSGFVMHSSGDYQKRSVSSEFLENRKRVSRIEVGHQVVAQDQVPLLFLQGCNHAGT